MIFETDSDLDRVAARFQTNMDPPLEVGMWIRELIMKIRTNIGINSFYVHVF